MHLEKVNYSLMTDVIGREHNTFCNPYTKLMLLVETSARDVTLKLHQLDHYHREA